MVLTPLPTDPPFFGGSANDRRAAILRAEQERADLRLAKIQAQSAPSATPQERIRRWEELHGLRLPFNANHKLLLVIASQTTLTVPQVQEEQVRRNEASSRPVPQPH